MVESLLRRFVEYEQRRWLVIILSLAIALAAILPLADEYTALCEEQLRLESLIASTQLLVENIDGLEARALQQAETLAQLEVRGISRQDVQRFRSDVVRWAKEADCQMRSVRVDSGRSRRWRENDQPLEFRPKGKAGKDTPFLLTTQTLSVSIVAPIGQVKDFLDKVHADERLIHVKGYNLRSLPGG
ncbi:MAG: hypothetical protein IIA67_07420, partial [Planctomycetes bacterium]|nr:hypothetical protein [Planctomycetota bacterium]